MKLKTVLKTTAISAVLLTLSFSNIKYSAILVKADDEKPAMNVEYHSKQDIINYYNQHPYDTDMETTYDVEPVVTPPYSAGVISSNVLENAQSMVNFVRYTAGLSSMTHIEQYYNEISQAASLCNYINNSLSHYPSQPELMSEDLYNLALEGASTSNIAMATYNLTIPDTIKMYLDDGDSGNISRVGHRRWILYPQLSGIGFGQVGGYSATNVINNSRNKDADEYGVAWPAQNTPIELLYNWSYQVSGYPWSITFGEKVSNDVNVTLTNLSTGQVWNFNNNSSDGEFYVNNAGYGQTGCVIFLPQDLTLNNGDSFKVDINNIGISDYQDSVTYNVNIFSLEEKNGLCLSEDGIWNYYSDGNIDCNYTGLALNEYGWWYVKNGTIDWNYTGMALNEYGWWYVKNGAIDFSYTGMALNEYGWWYIKNGALDLSYTGLALNEYGWWYMRNGLLDLSYTGLALNEYGWWYVKNGAIDLSYTGMALNEYGWWYVKNGALDLSYTGLAQNEYGLWYMKNGALDLTYTGTVKNENGTFKVVKGHVE